MQIIFHQPDTSEIAISNGGFASRLADPPRNAYVRLLEICVSAVLELYRNDQWLSLSLSPSRVDANSGRVVVLF